MTGRKFVTVRNGWFHQSGHLLSEVFGHLVNITFKYDNENGEIMRLHLVDESCFTTLSFFTNSRVCYSFCRSLANIDILEPMILRIQNIAGAENFYVVQDGKKVAWSGASAIFSVVPHRISECIKREISPLLQKKPNPFPNHAIYKPKTSRLQGGYFDEYAAVGRTVGPVSGFERNVKNYGK